MFPCHQDMKRLESFCFNRYKLRIPAGEDTGETVANRLKRQLSKRCIGFENIMETKTRKREATDTRVRRTSLVIKPS